MRLTALFWLCLSVLALAAPEGGDQDAAQWSSFKNAIKTMSFTNAALPLPTKTANLDNIAAPPRSLIGEVISAVPPSILIDLVVPTRRASLASEFSAGNTPAWYSSLPTDVKSYMKEVKSQINDGALTATTGLAAQTAASASATASATASASTSTGAAAAGPRATGGPLAASVMGAFGVLGVAVAL